MSVRIFVGREQGGSSGAILFDSTTGWAFGPIFNDAEEAESFLSFVDERTGLDVRRVADLTRLVIEFHRSEVKE